MKLYPKNKEEADRWIEDYEYLGWKTSIKDNVITVWWGNRKRVKKENAEKPERSSRERSRPSR